MIALSAPPSRIASIDAVRGFAVCGILLMNIVAMGLPAGAYGDPTVSGNQGPADMTAWLLGFIFVDGKMRALFTMLFGASMVLIADRAEAEEAGGAAEGHLRRMFWLFIFGMIHAWLLWYGDILVQYAVAGTLAFTLWRRQPRLLWTVFLVMLAVQLLQCWETYGEAVRAGTPGAGDEAGRIRAEIAGYRGGFLDAFAIRAPMTLYFQLVLLPRYLPETVGFIALGTLFFRNGFLTAAWPRRSYWLTIALGYLVAAPLSLPLARLLMVRDFAPEFVALSEGAGVLLRPFIALAHAAVVILLLRSGTLRRLTVRLEAAGRMAFSNYLGTSLITTSFFYGYGFGRFAMVSRAELYWVVLAVWALILLGSKPWLDRYRYGPLEWLWRTLARGRWQPMRGNAASSTVAAGQIRPKS